MLVNVQGKYFFAGLRWTGWRSRASEQLQIRSTPDQMQQTPNFILSFCRKMKHHLLALSLLPVGRKVYHWFTPPLASSVGGPVCSSSSSECRIRTALNGVERHHLSISGFRQISSSFAVRTVSLVSHEPSDNTRVLRSALPFRVDLSNNREGLEAEWDDWSHV